MASFERVASSQGARKIYDRVVKEIDTQNHPNFLDRPIRVLDTCGGSGIIGTLLKEQCETSLGPLSGDDFAAIVDYVNVDIDEKALKVSPGRTIRDDISRLHLVLMDEAPFDFILAINHSPKVYQYSTQELDRMGVPDDFLNPIRSIMLGSAEAVRSSLQRINLTTGALLLALEGKFILGGFMDEATISGIARFNRESGSGLKIRTDEKIPLDNKTLGLFVTADTGINTGKDLQRFKAAYPMYHILVMGIKESLVDRAKALSVLEKEYRDYRYLQNFCSAQEQFWS